MNAKEQKFNIGLDLLDATPEWQWSQTLASIDQEPEVTQALRIVISLRQVWPPESELEQARERAVARALDEENLATTRHSSGHTRDADSRQQRSHARSSRRTPQVRLMAAVALILIGLILGWQVSVAAATALPGTPLYSIKQGEEWVALRATWSDEQHGAVLADVAHRRLVEASAEADSGNTALATTLAGDFDDDMRQLISLTVHMEARHENTRAVADGLARNLRAEADAIVTAQQRGQTSLTQALSSTLTLEQQEITTQHIVLPTVAGGHETAPQIAPGAGATFPNPSGTASPFPGTEPKGTPSPPPHGKPTQTPSPDPGGNNHK